MATNVTALKTSSSAQLVGNQKRRPPKESFCEFDIVENYQKSKQNRRKKGVPKDASELTKKINAFAARNAEIEEMYKRKQASDSSVNDLQPKQISSGDGNSNETRKSVDEYKTRQRRTVSCEPQHTKRSKNIGRERKKERPASTKTTSEEKESSAECQSCRGKSYMSNSVCQNCSGQVRKKYSKRRHRRANDATSNLEAKSGEASELPQKKIITVYENMNATDLSESVLSKDFKGKVARSKQDYSEYIQNSIKHGKNEIENIECSKYTLDNKQSSMREDYCAYSQNVDRSECLQNTAENKELPSGKKSGRKEKEDCAEKNHKFSRNEKRNNRNLKFDEDDTKSGKNKKEDLKEYLQILTKSCKTEKVKKDVENKRKHSFFGKRGKAEKQDFAFNLKKKSSDHAFTSDDKQNTPRKKIEGEYCTDLDNIKKLEINSSNTSVVPPNTKAKGDQTVVFSTNNDHMITERKESSNDSIDGMILHPNDLGEITKTNDETIFYDKKIAISSRGIGPKTTIENKSDAIPKKKKELSINSKTQEVEKIKNVIELTADESLKKLLEIYKREQEKLPKGIYNRKEFRTTINIVRSPDGKVNHVKKKADKTKINRKELSFSNLNLSPIRGLYSNFEDTKPATTQTSKQNTSDVSLREIFKTSIANKAPVGKSSSNSSELDADKTVSQTTLALRDIYKVAELEKVNSARRKHGKRRSDKRSSYSDIVTKQDVKNKQKVKNIAQNNKFHTSKTVMPNERIVEISSKILKDDKVSFTVEGVEPAKRLEGETTSAHRVLRFPNLKRQIFPGIDINLSDVRLLNHGAKNYSKDSLEIPNSKTVPALEKVATPTKEIASALSSPRGKRSFNLFCIRKDAAKKKAISLRKSERRLEIFHNKSFFVQQNLQRYAAVDSTTQTSAREKAEMHSAKNIERKRSLSSVRSGNQDTFRSRNSSEDKSKKDRKMTDIQNVVIVNQCVTGESVSSDVTSKSKNAEDTSKFKKASQEQYSMEKSKPKEVIQKQHSLCKSRNGIPSEILKSKKSVRKEYSPEESFRSDALNFQRAGRQFYVDERNPKINQVRKHRSKSLCSDVQGSIFQRTSRETLPSDASNSKTLNPNQSFYSDTASSRKTFSPRSTLRNSKIPIQTQSRGQRSKSVCSAARNYPMKPKQNPPAETPRKNSKSEDCIPKNHIASTINKSKSLMSIDKSSYKSIFEVSNCVLETSLSSKRCDGMFRQNSENSSRLKVGSFEIDDKHEGKPFSRLKRNGFEVENYSNRDSSKSSIPKREFDRNNRKTVERRDSDNSSPKREFNRCYKRTVESRDGDNSSPNREIDRCYRKSADRHDSDNSSPKRGFGKYDNKTVKRNDVTSSPKCDFDRCNKNTIERRSSDVLSSLEHGVERCNKKTPEIRDSPKRGNGRYNKKTIEGRDGDNLSLDKCSKKTAERQDSEEMINCHRKEIQALEKCLNDILQKLSKDDKECEKYSEDNQASVKDNFISKKNLNLKESRLGSRNRGIYPSDLNPFDHRRTSTNNVQSIYHLNNKNPNDFNYPKESVPNVNSLTRGKKIRRQKLYRHRRNLSKTTIVAEACRCKASSKSINRKCRDCFLTKRNASKLRNDLLGIESVYKNHRGFVSSTTILSSKISQASSSSYPISTPSLDLGLSTIQNVTYYESIGSLKTFSEQLMMQGRSSENFRNQTKENFERPKENPTMKGSFKEKLMMMGRHRQNFTMKGRVKDKLISGTSSENLMMKLQRSKENFARKGMFKRNLLMVEKSTNERKQETENVMMKRKLRLSKHKLMLKENNSTDKKVIAKPRKKQPLDDIKKILKVKNLSINHITESLSNVVILSVSSCTLLTPPRTIKKKINSRIKIDFKEKMMVDSDSNETLSIFLRSNEIDYSDSNEEKNKTQDSNLQLPSDSGMISKEPFYIKDQDGGSKATSTDSLEMLAYDADLCPLTAIFNFSPPSYAYHVYNAIAVPQMKQEGPSSSSNAADETLTEQTTRADSGATSIPDNSCNNSILMNHNVNNETTIRATQDNNRASTNEAQELRGTCDNVSDERKVSKVWANDGNDDVIYKTATTDNNEDEKPRICVNNGVYETTRGWVNNAHEVPASSKTWKDNVVNETPTLQKIWENRDINTVRHNTWEHKGMHRDNPGNEAPTTQRTGEYNSINSWEPTVSRKWVDNVIGNKVYKTQNVSRTIPYYPIDQLSYETQTLQLHCSNNLLNETRITWGSTDANVLTCTTNPSSNTMCNPQTIQRTRENNTTDDDTVVQRTSKKNKTNEDETPKTLTTWANNAFRSKKSPSYTKDKENESIFDVLKPKYTKSPTLLSRRFTHEEKTEKKPNLSNLADASKLKCNTIKFNYTTKTNTPIISKQQPGPVKQIEMSQFLNDTPSGGNLSTSSSTMRASNESGYESSKPTRTNSIKNFFKKGGSLLYLFKNTKKSRVKKGKSSASSLALKMIEEDTSATSYSSAETSTSKTVLWFNFGRKKNHKSSPVSPICKLTCEKKEHPPETLVCKGTSTCRLFRKCTCMTDVDKQKLECKKYAEKVLMEAALRKEGYRKQYTDFKEIPLDVLMGKKMQRPVRRRCKECTPIGIQTKEITPVPSEKVIVEEATPEEEEKQVINFDDEKEATSLSNSKLNIVPVDDKLSALSVASQASVQERKLTDKEVFDRILENFERKSSIAERLSKDDDFFNEYFKPTPSHEDLAENKSETSLKVMDSTARLGDLNKYRRPRFTDKKIDCTVNAEDIGTCFARGFRPDNLMLSGDACFNLNKQDKIKMSPEMLRNTESIIDFSERETPLDFLLALGFMVDEASNALKDDDIRSRLLAAITEARVWINKITTTQGTLLYLVAYKARPETMRYFLQLVEAIINKRISNAIKLDGFLRVLEQVEDGRIQMITILGDDKFEDEENEEKIVKKQLKHLFVKMYSIAEQEALQLKKELNSSQVALLRILVAKYRAGLHAHLELIARYIGQGLLDSEVQLEAAMIFLSRLDTADVKLKEFENYCGIRCEKK